MCWYYVPYTPTWYSWSACTALNIPKCYVMYKSIPWWIHRYHVRYMAVPCWIYTSAILNVCQYHLEYMPVTCWVYTSILVVCVLAHVMLEYYLQNDTMWLAVWCGLPQCEFHLYWYWHNTPYYMISSMTHPQNCVPPLTSASCFA